MQLTYKSQLTPSLEENECRPGVYTTNVVERTVRDRYTSLDSGMTTVDMVEAVMQGQSRTRALQTPKPKLGSKQACA
jgi:hypothetical protein